MACLIVLGLVIAGGIGWVVWYAIRKHRDAAGTQTAMEPVVRAVEDLKAAQPQAGELLTALIGHHTDYADESVVKSVISAIKAKLNLNSPTTVFAPPSGAVVPTGGVTA